MKYQTKTAPLGLDRGKAFLGNWGRGGGRDTLMWTHQEGVEGVEFWSRPPQTQDTVAITSNLCQLLLPLCVQSLQ